MPECPHTHREYDSYQESHFTFQSARLLVPSWCADCSNSDADDYREEWLEFKARWVTLEPDYNGALESIQISDLEELELQHDDFLRNGNAHANFTAEFTAWYSIGYDTIKVTIDYQYVPPT